MSLPKPLIVALLSTLAVLLLAAWVWDRASSDTIANGVSVANVDVSGMNKDRARRKLESGVASRLTSSVKVSYNGLTHELSKDKIDLSVSVAAMVDSALEASRSGWFVSRTLKRITGEGIGAELPAAMRYDHDAFEAWISKTKKTIDRPPKEPSVLYSAQSVKLTRGYNGITVNRDALKRDLKTALGDPDSNRNVRPRGIVVKPKKTTAQVRKANPVILTVDRAASQVRLWKKFKLAKTYTVTVGSAGYETPAGLSEVQYKQDCPTWTPPNSDWVPEKLRGKTIPCGDPSNPLKARFIGFNGAAGFHGWGGAVGGAGSHGCIRMAIPDVKDLYKNVTAGDPVYIS